MKLVIIEGDNVSNSGGNRRYRIEKDDRIKSWIKGWIKSWIKGWIKGWIKSWIKS